MLTDSLSPWLVLSPGAPNCTLCTLHSSKPAGSFGQNPRGKKLTSGLRATGGPRPKDLPAGSLPPPQHLPANTHSKPRFALAGVCQPQKQSWAREESDKIPADFYEKQQAKP